MPFGDVIKRATIHATVEISIKKILRDPKRGIRNAVDLFDCFTRDKFDSTLIKGIRRDACNSKSAFFKTVYAMVKNVDPAILKTVGTNLCYNRVAFFPSREKKAEPSWEREISRRSLESVVQGGKERGIYFYILCGDSSLSLSGSILKTCRENGDCVFYILAGAKHIDGTFAQNAARAGNLILALDVSAEASSGALSGSDRRAFALLKRYRCLYGYSVRAGSAAALPCYQSEFIKRMANLGCLFGWYSCKPGQDRVSFTKAIQNMIRNSAHSSAPPVLLLYPELDRRLRKRFTVGGRCYLLLRDREIAARYRLSGRKAAP